MELLKYITNPVTIVVDDAKEIYGDSVLRVDQVSLLLLPQKFANLSMRFVTPDEKTVKLQELEDVELFDDSGASLGLITNFFQVGTDGSIAPANFGPLQSMILGQSGKLTIAAQGVDSEGVTHLGQVSFYVGRTTVTGTLLPPPSFPALNLASLRVVGRILNTDIVVSTLSSSTGTFAFPDFPAGNLEIFSQTLQNGLNYSGTGQFALSASVNVRVTMLPSPDPAANTPSSSLTINSVTPVPDTFTLNNDGTYYGIPRPSLFNTFQRDFYLEIIKPVTTIIQKVKVEVLGAGPDALVDEEAPGANVTLIDDQTIRVIGTFKTNSSSVISAPPPASAIQYRFTVTAQDSLGNTLTAQKVISGKTPLWRMPDGIPRYGARDPGGDDWVPRGHMTGWSRIARSFEPLTMSLENTDGTSIIRRTPRGPRSTSSTFICSPALIR